VPSSTLSPGELQLATEVKGKFISGDVATLNEKCFVPALKYLKGAARQAGYDVTVEFDAKGNETKRTYDEQKSDLTGAHPDLTKCLQEVEVPKLSIPATGSPVTAKFDYFF
jgi:hypothetical protein